jgi:hypothetical protein
VVDKLIMMGFAVTVKLTPLLEPLETVTTTFPLEAPPGTGTVMPVALQAVGNAVVPLKVTVLLPCVSPNPVPTTMTSVPTGPELGDKLVMTGKGSDVPDPTL